MDSGAWVLNFGQNLKFRTALWAGVGQGTFLKLPGMTDFCTLFPPPPPSCTHQVGLSDQCLMPGDIVPPLTRHPCVCQVGLSDRCLMPGDIVPPLTCHPCVCQVGLSDQCLMPGHIVPPLTRLEFWPFSGPFRVQKIIFSFRKIFSQYSVPYRT